ncbi:Importin subunit beta-2 [Pichia kudriavzevii]|uniref:Importin subunit beta-2 n=1 Tax=Pichia kudriavzevii TaxID=4909 RepID=A0A1V2LMK1_PICKU|nr:Importin subunit beta-2 [Pichia kudriavzevii]
MASQSSWTPDVPSLQQLVHIFTGTLSPDATIRQEATTALTQAKNIADFDNYLLHILLSNEIADSTRASAGIYLKNDLVKNFKYKPHELQANILQLVPHGLLSESPFVRHITAGIISAVFRAVGTAGWPSVVPDLIALISGAAGEYAIDGASEALLSICEDSSRMLEYEIKNNDGSITVPMQTLIPKLIELIPNSQPSITSKIRSRFLNCLVHCINVGSNTALINIDAILAIVFSMCQENNGDEEVQKAVASIFCGILEKWPEKLYPHWSGILQWCIHMVKQGADSVALQADEFLLSMSTSELPNQYIRPYLEDLIPVLLEKMVYDLNDVELMEAEDEKDVENMNASTWPIREASILTLGAISEAALNHATMQLPELIPFLVDRLKDDQPRVRQITCWTLGRYSHWVCSEAQSGGSFASYFTPTFRAIMECALDSKKVVQESACSSLSDFIESSEPQLLSQFIEPLLHHFQAYFTNYRRKNLIVLYDTIQTFVEKVGEALRYNQKFMDLLLPPLMEKWQTLNDDDKDLWPLLECMSSVAASTGEAFASCAMPVYERALRILNNCIEQDKMATSDPSFVPPEKDFIVTSLDLIDGLVQGLTQHSAELINRTDSSAKYSLMELVLTCLDDNVDDVRQSAYALIGDFAIYLFPTLILPYLQPLMISIYQEIGKLNEYSVASCNNAIWALGEISIRSENNILDQYLANFLRILEPLVLNFDADITLLENAAVTIGRFGIHYPDQTSVMANDVLIVWCQLIGGLEDNEEKASAVQGMCNIVLKHPEIVNALGNMRAIVELIANYHEPTVELAEIFKVLLTGLKSGLGAEWDRIVSGTAYCETLSQRYGV